MAGLNDLFFKDVGFEIAFNGELSYKYDIGNMVYHYSTLERLTNIILSEMRSSVFYLQNILYLVLVKLLDHLREQL